MLFNNSRIVTGMLCGLSELLAFKLEIIFTTGDK